MIIVFAKDQDKEKIINLWQEAFLEKREDIEPFVNKYLENFVLLKNNEKLCSMLCMMSVSVNNDRGRYIYAVATKKEYQNRGYSTKLLEFSKEYIEKDSEKFLVLVPAKKELFDFYEKRGYEKIKCIKKNRVLKADITENELKVKVIDEREYYKKRKEKLKGYSLISWSENDLLNIKNIYGGEFLCIEEIDAVFFGYLYNSVFYAKELLCDKEAIKITLGAIAKHFNPKEIEYAVMGDEPFAMITGEKYKNMYFNIAID